MASTPDNDLGDCFYRQGWVNKLGPEFDPPYPCGGGLWTRPHVNAHAPSVAVTFNDFSNMNGSRFPTHRGHRDGISGDAHWPISRTAQNARDLIAILRAGYPHIQRILITHERNFQNPSAFFRELLTAPDLPDGQRVVNRIGHSEGHTNHIHIYWRAQ